jgi:hypothetical protein
VNIDIPEPVRAWAWHTLRALAVLAALAATVTVGSLLLLSTAYAIAGHGNWLLPATIAVVGVLATGTVTWLKADKTRPPSRFEPDAQIRLLPGGQIRFWRGDDKP